MPGKLKSHPAFCLFACGISTLVILSGCGGGGGGGSQNPTPPAITVSVSPQTASLNESATQTFTANVANDSSNAGVTWSIGTGAGTLSATTTTSVTYTAPASIAASATVTLTATSKASAGTSASAAITLNPPPPPTITSVVAACVPTSVQTGATSQCTATVAGTGSFSTAVTWSVGGITGGNAALGTISSAGLYTAPSAVPATNPVSIAATSVQDGTKSGSSSVTVTAATPTITSVAAACLPASIPTGSMSQCTATVMGTGSFSTAVTWSVSGIIGGNSALGTISSTGLYTAPSTVPVTNPIAITATSTANTAKSGSASVTITTTATITAVTAACAPTSVQTSATSQCTATVTGTGSYSSTVTWSAGGIAGGNSTVGTISSAGLYTAPAAIPATNPVTITAISTANNAKSGSATITITAAPTITSVAAACVPTSVQTSATSQCTATVSGTGSYSSAVTWAVGGVAGGNSTLGTISSAGLYTAPATIPTTNPVTITATSSANTAKSGSASVTITASTATITSVAASCLSGSVQTGATSQCAATVTGTGSYSSAVTWAVGGVTGGNSTLGTISTSGLYTAPATVPATNPVTITATSTANSAKSGSYSITITAAPATITSVTAACVPTSIETGTTSQCTATVTGTGSYSSTVTWAAGGIAGGNATVGTISAAGLYTAPSAVPATNPVSITATSSANTAKSGSASVTVTAASSGGITISALGATSINPLATLTVTGTGFAANTQAISVMFITTGGQVVTVPVSASDATTLQVVVPPQFNSTNSNFPSATVDVQVMQVASSTTSFSNVLTGLTINALPPAPTTIPAGSITAAYLGSGLNVAASMTTLITGNTTYSNLASPLSTYSADLSNLMSAVNTVVANPSQTVTIPLANGATTTLNAATLAISDALIQAEVTQLVSQIPITVAAASTFTNCPQATGDTTFDNNICSLQNFFQGITAVPAFSASRLSRRLAHPAEQSEATTKAAQTAVANLIIGSVAVVVCPECGLAYGLFVCAAGAYATSLAIEGATPPGPETAKGLLFTYADDLLDAGFPVIGTSYDAYNLLKSAADDDPADNGSILSSGLTGMLPGGITGIFSPGASTTTTTLVRVPAAVPQETVDTTTLVVAPASTYTLNVNIVGSGSVISFPEGVSCAVSCSVAFPQGVVVGLNPDPTLGYSLQSWTGACTGTGSCSITMSGNQTVTATFTNGGETFTGTISGTGSYSGLSLNVMSGTMQIVTDGPLVDNGLGVGGSYSINGQVYYTYFNGSAPVTEAYVNGGDAAFTVNADGTFTVSLLDDTYCSWVGTGDSESISGSCSNGLVAGTAYFSLTAGTGPAASSKVETAKKTVESK